MFGFRDLDLGFEVQSLGLGSGVQGKARVN